MWALSFLGLGLLGTGAGLGWWLRGLHEEPTIASYRNALHRLAVIRNRLETDNTKLASQLEVAELRYHQAAGIEVTELTVPYDWGTER